MEKKLNTPYNQTNLLADVDFISLLKFEADYAASIKGGNLPYYYSREKRSRIVNDVNLLSSTEQKEIIYSLFSGKN